MNKPPNYTLQKPVTKIIDSFLDVIVKAVFFI